MLLSKGQSVKSEMQAEPLVGIAMATFNPGLSYFIDQISSLKNQSYKNWKCILVDDNSNDEKFKNILEIIGADPRFEVHRNGTNLGSFKTFERALSLVPTDVDLVCFCDQDDIWITTKLELQIKAFEDASVFLVHTDQSLIDEKGRVFVASCWDLEGRSVFEATTDLLLFRNLITGCTTMFRRKVLESALPFFALRPLKEMYHHDMWVAMHACVHGRVLGIKQPLVLYRQHGGNLVGVSSLRKNVKFTELVSRATCAFSERVGLREDFFESLAQCKTDSVDNQKKKLSYLDNLGELIYKGLVFLTSHPRFFRTWIMLCVGYFSFHIKKRAALSSDKVY